MARPRAAGPGRLYELLVHRCGVLPRLVILHAFVQQQLYNVDVRGAALRRRAYYERSDVGQPGEGGAAGCGRELRELMSLSVEVRGSARKKGDSSG